MNRKTELEIDNGLIEDIIWKIENPEIADDKELEVHKVMGAVGYLSHSAARGLNQGDIKVAAARLEDLSVICEHWCTMQEQSK